MNLKITALGRIQDVRAMNRQETSGGCQGTGQAGERILSE